MTITEARERAGKLWGHDRIIHIEVRADGWIEVELKPVKPTWNDDGHATLIERTYSYHRMDSTGHVMCHAACQSLEQLC